MCSAWCPAGGKHPRNGRCCYCCPCYGQQEDFLFFNHFELRGTKRHEPTPYSPLHGYQHLRFWVSEMGTIPSVPSACPGGSELPSLLLAKQLGQVLRWGTLQGEEQVTGWEVGLASVSSAGPGTLVCSLSFARTELWVLDATGAEVILNVPVLSRSSWFSSHCDFSLSSPLPSLPSYPSSQADETILDYSPFQVR